MVASEHGDDIIIEFYRVGRSVKVSAMDPRTLTEVSIVGPATAGEATLKQAVLKRLEYVMARKRGEAGRRAGQGRGGTC